MKILHMTPFYKPDVGGMETFTAHLVNGLQKRGHVNTVVTTHKTGELPDLSEVDGVPVHRGKLPAPAVQPRSQVGAAREAPGGSHPRGVPPGRDSAERGRAAGIALPLQQCATGLDRA